MSALSAGRVILGFIIAPLVAALLLAALVPLYAGLHSLPERIFRTLPLYLVVGGYVPTIIFGIPAYFLLRKRLRPTAVNCALIGAAVAIAPWFILRLVTPLPNEAFSGGHVTVLHQYYTFWGWLDLATNVGYLFLLGAFAGFVFWFVAAFRPNKKR